MTEIKEEYVWLEVPINNLVEFDDFYSMSKKYRCNHPVGLVTPLGDSGCSLLNLLSPKDAAFWCAVDLRVAWNINKQLFAVNQKRGIKTRIKRLLDDYGVVWDSPVSRLFDGLRDELSRKRTVPGFSHDGVTTPESCRLISLAISSADIAKVKDYLQEEIHQFRRYSFLAVDDYLLYGGSTEYSPGAYLFATLFGVRNAEDAKKYYGQLKLVVGRLENDILIDLHLTSWEILGPPLNFYMLDIYNQGNSIESRFGSVLVREILSYRARLVNLLRWPVFYDQLTPLLRPK